MDEEEQKNQERRRQEHTGLQSRITAGPISNIRHPNLVKRIGYCNVLESVAAEGDKWKKQFSIHSQEYSADSFFLSTRIESYGGYRNIRVLAKDLKENNLYIAHFRAVFSSSKVDGKGNDELFFVAEGDLYADKDVTVEDIIKPRQIANSR